MRLALSLVLSSFTVLLGPAPPPLARAAGATQIVEPGSGQRYGSPLQFDGKSYTLVGTGLHVDKEGGGRHQPPPLRPAGPAPAAAPGSSRVYSMALYVEDSARQSFPAVYDRAGRTRAGLNTENRAQNFFVWGHFSKLAVLRALRPIDHEELGRLFRDGLGDILGPQANPDLRKDALAFLALFEAVDLKEGGELRVVTDDAGHLDIAVDGKRQSGPQNPKLCRHVWDIWLGFSSGARETRTSLLERLDVLAK